MKKKRYFYDYWAGKRGSIGVLPFLIVILSLGLIVPIGVKFRYAALISEHRNDLNAYSDTTYKYLDEIADNVIHEGVGIDILALPDDVVKCELIKENKSTVFRYYLENNNSDKEIVISAYMTVVLSDELEIISKTPNCSSEEDYKGKVKNVILFRAIVEITMVWIAFIVVILIILTMIAVASKAKKDRDLY